MLYVYLGLLDNQRYDLLFAEIVSTTSETVKFQGYVKFVKELIKYADNLNSYRYFVDLFKTKDNMIIDVEYPKFFESKFAYFILQDRINEALLKYKELNGSKEVPFAFIVPNDDKTWPEKTRGLPLGDIFHENFNFDNFMSVRLSSILIEDWIFSRTDSIFNDEVIDNIKETIDETLRSPGDHINILISIDSLLSTESKLISLICEKLSK